MRHNLPRHARATCYSLPKHITSIFVTSVHTEIEEFFVEELLSTVQPSATAAIFATTISYKTAFASSAVYAFVNAAITFESELFQQTRATHDLINQVYKASALFSVDMFAAETLLRRQITCGDVYDIWRQTHDPIFLPNRHIKKEGDRSPPL